MNNHKVFFAFGKAVESKDSVEIKRYVGVAPVQIVAINPTKAELENIYNTTLEREPEYLGSVERDGKNIPHIRIDFIVRTNPEKSKGIEMTTKMSFFIRKAFMTNRDNTKVKVVDKYGRTAWVTQDEFKNKLIPQYANGPARIDSNYRALYMGEEELLSFVKNYLGIQEVDEYVNGTWQMRANPADYEAGFNNIENWIKGDISEVKNAIAMMPNNYVKVLFGVRHTDDGKDYQDVFTRATMKYGAKKNTVIEKALKEAKEAGAYANSDFEICELKEWNPTPTNLNTPVVDDLPFADDDPWK